MRNFNPNGEYARKLALEFETLKESGVNVDDVMVAMQEARRRNLHNLHTWIMNRSNQEYYEYFSDGYAQNVERLLTRIEVGRRAEV